MSALLVGVLVVMVSAVGFGAAMFGRRPVPQRAMQFAGAPVGAVTVPSQGGAGAGSVVDADDESPKARVDIPASIRLRSICLLALGVLGAAALLGVLLSIVVVGLSTFIN
jgi:hypothetical protein